MRRGLVSRIPGISGFTGGAVIPDKCYQGQPNTAVKSVDSGGNCLVYISMVLPLDLLSRANYLSSLCFVLPMCKMGLILALAPWVVMGIK